MRLYNTLTRSVEEIKPIENNTIKMYCCGPTVYNYAHIGNLRTYIFEDILVKTLKSAGFNVLHAMNITDVGHLTDDADAGEDKMLLAVRREQKSVLDIARFYENAFFADTAALGLNRPTVVCRATEHIQDMIRFVKGLQDKGFAYISGGNVYFDTSKFPEYGKLSGQKREDLLHGARTEQDSNKKNPSDFVLWFTVSKFENQILQWDSPWGRGYPGWHIECSAMAMKYLGEYADIHCGGIDHIPVHHENEIAQSEAYLGHTWIKTWCHAEFLQTKNTKMSKSSGNFLTVSVLKEKGYNPLHYKYFCLQSHYRSQANFTFENLDAARNAYENLKERVMEIKRNAGGDLPDTQVEKQMLSRFYAYLYEDLAVPSALTVLWDCVKAKDMSAATKMSILLKMDEIFSLGISEFSIEELVLPPQIQDLIHQRQEARKNKDWAASDKIRETLLSLGFAVKDLPNGQVEVKKV